MMKLNVRPVKWREESSNIIISDEEREKRYYYNQLKKRRKVIDLISINFKEHFSCFVTLTFAKSSISLKETIKNFERLTANLRRDYDNFIYVATIEFQTNGNLHYHLVCNIANEINATESISKHWKHGEIDVEEVYNIQDLAKYMTKDFLTQDRTSPLFGQRCYKHSQNLEKPLVAKSWDIGHERFENIKNSLVEGMPKKVVKYNENVGEVEYNTYALGVDSIGLFGDYIIVVKRLQF